MLDQADCLEECVQDALNDPENVSKAKKVHALFLRETLILPVERKESDSTDEPIPLYLTNGEARFLPVFSTMSHYQSWAKDEADKISLLHLTGSDLVKGIGEAVYICFDIGQSHYKEFSPEEIKRLQSIVSKLESLVKKNKS
jgi:hypothetical protein